MLQNFFKNFAAKQWEIFSYKDEWGTVIFFVLLAKILTCAVSIFSGFAYLDNFLFGCLNNETAALIFSIIILLLIEGLNWFLLDKTFKFMLHAEYKTAVLPSLFATAIFILSFNLSANGIAIWKAEKADLSNDINEKYSLFEESAKNGNAAELQEIDQNISDIKANPEQWSNGKRCVLSAQQNTALQSLYDRKSQLRNSLKDELKKLEAERKQELSENATNTTDQAERFYLLVAAIMIAQFLCNLYLMYSWKKIHVEENPEQVKADRINMTFAAVGDTIDSGIESVIDAKRAEMDTMFTLMKRQPLGKLRVMESDSHTHETDHDNEAQPTEKAAKADKVIKGFGFVPDDGNASETPQPKTPTETPGTPENAPTETPTETPEETPQTETQHNGVQRYVPSPENAPGETAEKAAKSTPINATKTPLQERRRNANGEIICECQECQKVLTVQQIEKGARFCSPAHRLKQWKIENANRRMNLKLSDATN